MIQKTDIVNPFDPSQIDVDIAVVNMGYLLDQLDYGMIDLSPEFQRASNLWNKEQKSRLIESVLLGLPLPSFYFSEYNDDSSKRPKLQVIDGLQRLCALIDFVVDKRLHLVGLQFLKEYEGRCWNDLGTIDQMNFRSLKITMNTLRKGTPAKVKYVIFQRVNTAGKPLKPQEMRWALNQGKATRLLKRMAEDANFLEATCYRISSRRMGDLDYANRFLAFYLYQEQYGNFENLDEFMNVTLDKVNGFDDRSIAAIENAFSNSMRTCADIFGRDAFRKRVQEGHRRNPLSKALFDAISVNIAKLTAKEQHYLIEHRFMVKDEMIKMFNDSKFINATYSSTSNEQSVNTRFDMIMTMLKTILRNAYIN